SARGGRAPRGRVRERGGPPPPARILVARLAADPADVEPIEGWLAQHALGHQVQAGILSYTLPWESAPRERADFAAALQARLAEAGAPFHELEEQESSLESVYLDAMASPPGAEEAAPAPARFTSGIAPRPTFASIAAQGQLLRLSLPFYVSSWWRRGDLSWVMYLNAFVLLLVAMTSLFGQLPGPASQVVARLAGGSALQAGLLLPLFFMSFALL